MIGSSLDQSNKVNVEMINGIGKKRKFKFSGFDSLDSAKTIIGKTIFAQTSLDAKINWISKKILNYKVTDESGNSVGRIIDVIWLQVTMPTLSKKNQKSILFQLFQRL